MAHSFASVPSVVIDDLTPGTVYTYNVTVDATQPPTSTVGSVSAEFDGETVTAPLNISFNTGPIVPQVVVDLGTATNLAVTVGTPVRRSGWPNLWDVPVTITVV